MKTETRTMNLKLKGRKLYDGDRVVAEIRGYREMVGDGVYGDFCVIKDGIKIAEGFCYFRDAVKWAKDVIPTMTEKS